MNKKNTEESTDDSQEIHSKTVKPQIFSLNAATATKEKKEAFFQQMRDAINELCGVTDEK